MAYSNKWILKNFEAAKRDATEMMLLGLSSRDYANYSRKNHLDIDLLECEFTKICPDFPVAPSSTSDLQASKLFAITVLYNISPHLCRPKNKDHMRVVTIVNKDPAAKSPAYVYIYKKTPPPEKATILLRAINGTMHMTLMQDCLLALKKMEQIIDLAAAKGNYLITPLAQNAFCGSITELHRELQSVGFQHSIAHLVKTINQSAYNGGNILQYSELYAAVPFAIASRAYLTDRTQAKYHVETTIKWYQFAGKKVDIQMLGVFAKYVSRGRIVTPDPEYFRQLCTTKPAKMAEVMRISSWKTTTDSSDEDTTQESEDEFESAEEYSEDYESAQETSFEK